MTPPAVDQIVSSFRERVCRQVDLIPEGVNRYVVSSPFVHDDGDCLEIVLIWANDKWVLVDEGCTFMRLTYDIDEAALHQGTRQKVIANALGMFGVEDREGQLVLPVPEDRFGDALYSFIQAILKISDVSYLSREQVRSTFLQDFRAFLAETIPEDQLTFDWRDKEHDPRGIYQADCRIELSERPLFVFGLASDLRTRDTTITLLQYEKWGLPFRSMVVFENQQSIGRNVLARLTDVTDRQYSSLGGNKDRIRRHLEDMQAA
ncbi:MAG: DUF1828 domain-containing protein [Bryobacterales bacterium]|nr:DUF1828 domain-containing protein [Bryobacterales bacterium]